MAKSKYKIVLFLSFSLLFPAFTAHSQVGVGRAKLYWEAAKLGMAAQQWVHENVAQPAYGWYLNNVWGINKPTGFGERALFEAGTALSEIGVTVGVGGATQGVQQAIRGAMMRTAGRFGIAEFGGQVGEVVFTGKVLGRGSAGTVYEAMIGGKEVAVKIYTHAVNLTEKELYKSAFREARIARRLAEEGIGGVEYHGEVYVGGRLGIITNKIPSEAMELGEKSLAEMSGLEYAAYRKGAEEVAQELERLGLTLGDYQFALTPKGKPLLYDLGGLGHIKELLTPEEIAIGPVQKLLKTIDQARNVALARRAAFSGNAAVRTAKGLAGGGGACVGFICKPLQ